MRLPAVSTLRLLAGLLVGTIAPSLAVPASVADIPMQAGGSFSVPVTSLKDRRFLNTIHQRYDFSCGSAALATLLTHHYRYPVSEQQVFQEMFQRGDQARIRQQGFSLLDLKRFLAAHGFEGDGYQVDVEKLAVARIPAIALIKESGYLHFVVVKGLRDGRILLGDPAMGTRAMPLTQFKTLWVNRILMIVRNKTKLATFNGDSDWRAAPRAAFADGIYRGAAGALLPKYGPSDF